MKIDAHQHFWRYKPARDAWITDQMAVLKRDFLPEHLARELDASDIEASVAVQTDQSENETMFLLDLANQTESVAGVVGWVDLLSPYLAQRLEHFSLFEKLCGFRHIAQAEKDDRFLARDAVVKGIDQLRQLGFSYDILIYARQLPAAIDLVSRVPEQRFVIDHLAKPEIRAQKLVPWTAQMKELAQSKNVFCKLSGLVTEADWRTWKPEDFKPYLDAAFESFGADRVMFGSDWPVCLLAATYHQVKQVVEDYVQSYSKADQDKIFGGNAALFYGLKAATHGFAA